MLAAVTTQIKIKQGISSGYKKTEVGVIPEDWAVDCLSELVIAGPKNGYSGPCSKDARGTPTLTLTATSAGCLVLNDGTVKSLNETIDPRSDLFLKSGDVLVQRANTLDLVGTTVVFNGPSGVYAYPDLMMRLRFKEEVTAHWFWRYANSAAGRRFFISIAAGSSGSMPKINGEKLRKMPIPLPPLPQRRAIVQTLNDADMLIDSLERLVAKKRNLKQAAMQQLPTGKIRLPGFRGDWQNILVRDVIIDYFCGPSPTCEERNISDESEWGVLKTTAATKENGWDWQRHKVLPKPFWNKPHLEVTKGDVIITKAGPRHRVGVVVWVDYVPPRIIVSGKMIGLRPHPEKAVPLMLAAAISAPDVQLYLNQRTTGMAESQVNFENKALLEAPIKIPHIEEQRAIAQILSDMDAEIGALEKRLAKTRNLKQAMMQGLITGKIRLVNTISSELELAETQKKSHNWEINEAVVISVLSKQFGNKEFPLGRKRYTKFSYLLHRHVENYTAGYLKKAAGPYNPETKYKGPEDIAQRNGYIQKHTNGQYSGFIIADKITKAEAYFYKWYGQEVLQWLEQFRYKSNDELELLATVDMAIQDLRKAQKEGSLQAVKEIIRNHPEWEAKLERPIFADAKINAAIKDCENLFVADKKIL